MNGRTIRKLVARSVHPDWLGRQRLHVWLRFPVDAVPQPWPRQSRARTRWYIRWFEQTWRRQDVPEYLRALDAIGARMKRPQIMVHEGHVYVGWSQPLDYRYDFITMLSRMMRAFRRAGVRAEMR